MTKTNTNIQNLLNNGLNKKKATQIFNSIINLSSTFCNKKYNSNLTKMFNYALSHDTSLFPNIRVEKDPNLTKRFKEYISNWCNKYYENRNNPALQRPLKNYGEKDPALIERVTANTQQKKSVLHNYLEGHFIYMSAENMNGNILEEYLAQVLEPYGWIWCAGTTFKAIDLCYLKQNHEILLQVKNKYNTENSSSSAIRNGTKIIKWSRLQRPKKKTGLDRPIPNWEQLAKITNANDALSKLLTEKKYLDYIKKNSTTKIDTL